MKTTPNSNTNELVVLMPARNESRTISSAVSAVNDSHVPGMDTSVLVCANACTDNTVEVLEAMRGKHKNMDVITEAVPGKPRALNALIDKAELTHRMGSEDVVMFLDANAKVQESTMSDLVHMLKSDKTLKAVSANDLALPPKSQSVLEHLLFGVSEISLSSLALRDRKASCTAVRAKAVKGMRFPEHVISDDLWMAMYLGTDSVETHPDAFVTVQPHQNFASFATNRVKHLMGLYQLEEFFPAHQVRENFPTGTHEHVQAFMVEDELQDQFMQLPAVYQAASVLALPIHAALKVAAWVGYRIMPKTPRQTRNAASARVHSRADRITPAGA